MSKTRSLSRISKILTKKKTLSKHPKTTKMNQDLTYQKKRNLFSITQDQRWVLSSQQTNQWWLSSRCSNNNWNSCSANKLNSSSSKETFKLLTSMSRKTHSLKKKKIAIPKLMKKTRSCHPTQSSRKMHNWESKQVLHSLICSRISGPQATKFKSIPMKCLSLMRTMKKQARSLILFSQNLSLSQSCSKVCLLIQFMYHSLICTVRKTLLWSMKNNHHRLTRSFWCQNNNKLRQKYKT